MDYSFKNAQGVIFDCDGTILDSLDMWNEMERDLCRRAGIPYTKELADLLTTLTLPESARWFHEQGYLGSADEVVAVIDDFIMDYYANKAKPKPGAVAFVEGLYERGVKLTLASSTPHAQLEIGMQALGLRPCFMEIVSVEDVGASKRERLIYDTCRDVMGTPIEHTWGVEDATYALRTLRKAGYPSVGIYDRDESGTWEDICAQATIAIRSWDNPCDLALLS